MRGRESESWSQGEGDREGVRESERVREAFCEREREGGSALRLLLRVGLSTLGGCGARFRVRHPLCKADVRLPGKGIETLMAHGWST